MKKKVTKFLCEMVMSDLAEESYVEDICESDDIHSIKVLNKEDIEIDVEED